MLSIYQLLGTDSNLRRNWNSLSLIFTQLSYLTVYFRLRHRSRAWSIVWVRGKIVSVLQQQGAETITKYDLKPEKWKQERFISVERLSSTVINVTNLVWAHVFVAYLTVFSCEYSMRVYHERTGGEWIARVRVNFEFEPCRKTIVRRSWRNLIKAKATLLLSKMPPQGD